MLNRIFLSLLFFSLLPPGISHSETLTAMQVAERLQAKYDQTTSMTADFIQVSAAKMSSRQKKGSGTIILLKPGRMRWDYETPDKQVIVCDGKDLSMYFAKEKQFMVSPAKQYLESDVTYSFFAGTGNLIRDFEISAAGDAPLETDENVMALKIVPRQTHPQVDYIILWTDKNYLIDRLMIVDKFGSTTNIEFGNIKLNPKIAENAFTFQPPEGTEIINQ